MQFLTMGILFRMTSDAFPLMVSGIMIPVQARFYMYFGTVDPQREAIEMAT